MNHDEKYAVALLNTLLNNISDSLNKAFAPNFTSPAIKIEDHQVGKIEIEFYLSFNNRNYKYRGILSEPSLTLHSQKISPIHIWNRQDKLVKDKIIHAMNDAIAALRTQFDPNQ